MAIGGGSVAAGATILATAALSTYAGVTAAREQRRAGRFAEAQSEIDAKAEGDAARQREIERKRGLMRALSSQVASAGAAGVGVEGSLARIAQLDIARSREDIDIDTANTRARQSALRQQGRVARAAGRTSARLTLLDTAGSLFTQVGGNFDSEAYKKAKAAQAARRGP
jgi:hypothetical protein